MDSHFDPNSLKPPPPEKIEEYIEQGLGTRQNPYLFFVGPSSKKTSFAWWTLEEGKCYQMNKSDVREMDGHLQITLVCKDIRTTKCTARNKLLYQGTLSSNGRLEMDKADMFDITNYKCK